MDFEKEQEIDESLKPVVASTASLIEHGNEITEQIIKEEDPDELNKLTQLFTINQKKKQIARTNKLSNLLELVDDEVINRFSERPDAIEDENLLKYWRVTQDSINNNNNNEQELPRVQVTNNTVNINSSGLNRESRAKVLEAVKEILNNSLQTDNVIDIEVDKKDNA